MKKGRKVKRSFAGDRRSNGFGRVDRRVSFVRLPEIGIFGNTHFAFSDLNNVEIADLVSQFLHEKCLDRR
jgi:hypothetical protein